MPAPWLSVLIPAHNGERWVASALESIASQPEAVGIECVLLDSTEDAATAKAAESFAPRMMLDIRHRPDLLPWQAKTNAAAAMARAPHLCMLHQDDLWLPGRAAAARRWIEAAPETVLHLNASRIVDEQERSLGLWRCPLPAGRALAPGELLDRLIVQNFVAIPAPIMRRDAYLRGGGLDETLWYTADWDVYLRLGTSGEVRYHPEVLTAFRVHGSSLTVTGSRSAEAFEQQMRTVLERYRTVVAGPGRDAVLRRAEVSIAVNVALASAMHGDTSRLPRTALSLLGLGPLGLASFFRDTRLHERVLPRLRARLLARS